MCELRCSLAIVGAGTSGLAAARHFKASGYKVTIFERNSEIGGVWANAYDTACLQSQRFHYRFFDFPHEGDPFDHPNKFELLQYFNDYAKHFQILELIKFDTTVVSLKKRDGAKGWNITYKVQDKNVNEGEQSQDFDYVIWAGGIYSSEPNIPTVQGRENFNGQVLHSLQIQKFDVFNGNKVVIVGYGKTAMDFASEAANLGCANEVHMVIRKSHWVIPRRIQGISSLAILNNRAVSSTTTSWYHLPWEAVLHYGNAWIPQIVGRSIANAFVRECGWNTDTKSPLIPKHSLALDQQASIPLAPEGFFDMVRDGQIQVHVENEIDKFTNKMDVQLSSGEVIENVDVVVFATGYKEIDFQWLPKDARKFVYEDGLQLYRHIIHPCIPDMAFIGFNHSFLHMTSCEIGCLWLLQVIKGEINLPSVEEQLKSIEAIKQFKRETLHFDKVGGMQVAFRCLKYLDELMLDMGLRPLRKIARYPLGYLNPFAWVAELTQQYCPSDYESVARELQSKSKS